MKKVLSILLSVMLILSTMTCLMLVPATAVTVGTVSAADGGYLVDNGDGTKTAKAYYGNTFVAWYNEAGDVVSYNTTIGAVEENVVAKFNNYNLIPNGNFEDADITGFDHTMPANSGVYVERVNVPGTNAGHGSYALQVNTDSYQTTSMNHVVRFPSVTVEKNTNYVLRYSMYAVYEGTKYFYTTFQSAAADALPGAYYNYSYSCVIPQYSIHWGVENAAGLTPAYSAWTYAGYTGVTSALTGPNTHYSVGVGSGKWVDIVIMFNTGSDISMFAEGADTGEMWFNVAVGNDDKDGTDGSPNFYVDNVSLTKVSETAKAEMTVVAGGDGTVSGPAVANKGAFGMHYFTGNKTFGDANYNDYADGAIKNAQFVTNTGVYTATPAEGYSFIKWVDANGNTVSTKATDFLANDGTVKAVFAKGVAAGEGGYLVDNGDGTVTAKPYYGNTFLGWYDADDALLTGGEWDTLTVTKDKALGVTAKFNVYNLIPDGSFEANDGSAEDFYSVKLNGGAFSVETAPSTSNVGHGSNALYVTSDGPSLSSAAQYLLAVPMTLKKNTQYVFSFSYYLDGVANGGPEGTVNSATSGIAHVFFQSAKSHANNWTASGNLGSWSLAWGAEKADASAITPGGWCYKGNSAAIMGATTHASVGTGQKKWIEVYVTFNTGEDTTMFASDADEGEFWVTIGNTYDDVNNKKDSSSNFYVDNLVLTEASESAMAGVSVSATEGGSVTGPAVAQKGAINTKHYATGGGAKGEAAATWASGNAQYAQIVTNTGAYTATANDGYFFAGWYVGDTCISTSATTDIFVGGPVVAKFVEGAKAANGGYLVENSDGTVTAKAYYGNVFTGWSNGLTDATVDAAAVRGATANFTVNNWVVDGSFEAGKAQINDGVVGNVACDTFAQLGGNANILMSIEDAPGTNYGHGDKALYVDYNGYNYSGQNTNCYVLRTQNFPVEAGKKYIFAYSIYMQIENDKNPSTTFRVHGSETYKNSWSNDFVPAKYTMFFDTETDAGEIYNYFSGYRLNGGVNQVAWGGNMSTNIFGHEGWYDVIFMFEASETNENVFFSIGSGNGDSSTNFYVDNVSFAEATTVNPLEGVNVSAVGGNAYVTEFNVGGYQFYNTNAVGNGANTYEKNQQYLDTEDSAYYYSPVVTKSYEAVADNGMKLTNWTKDGVPFGTDATIEIAGPGNYVANFESIAQSDGLEGGNPNDVAGAGNGTTFEYATYTEEQKAMVGYTADMGDTYVKVTNTGDSHTDFSVPVSMKAGVRYLVHLKLMVISSDVADPTATWTEENPIGPELTSRFDFRFTKQANMWESFDAWQGKVTISGPNGTAGFTKAVEDEDKNWYTAAWFSTENQKRFGSDIVDLYYDVTATEDAVAYVTFGQWAGGEFGVDCFTVTEVADMAPTMVGATFNPTVDKTADAAMYVTAIDLPSFVAVSSVKTYMGVASELAAAGRADDFDATVANVTTASLTAYDAVGYLTRPASPEAFRKGEFYTTFNGASTTAQKVKFSVRSEITLTDCYGNDLGITLGTDNVYSRSINQIKRLLAKSLGADAATYNNADVAVAWQYVLDNAPAAE